MYSPAGSSPRQPGVVPSSSEPTSKPTVLYVISVQGPQSQPEVPNPRPKGLVLTQGSQPSTQGPGLDPRSWSQPEVLVSARGSGLGRRFPILDPRSWSQLEVLVSARGPCLGPRSRSQPKVPGPQPKVPVLAQGPRSSAQSLGRQPKVQLLALGPWSLIQGPCLSLRSWSWSKVPCPQPSISSRPSPLRKCLLLNPRFPPGPCPTSRSGAGR